MTAKMPAVLGRRACLPWRRAEDPGAEAQARGRVQSKRSASAASAPRQLARLKGLFPEAARYSFSASLLPIGWIQSLITKETLPAYAAIYRTLTLAGTGKATKLGLQGGTGPRYILVSSLGVVGWHRV